MGGDKVIYNGELLDAKGYVVPANNRALKYGDGLFETIRIINGKLCFIESHMQRLQSGAKALKIKVDSDLLLNKISNEMRSLVENNSISEGGRCRLTISRKSGGYYHPKDTNGFDYLIEAESIQDNNFVLNETGLDIDVYTERVKQISPTSNYKTLNCELNIMASIFANETGFDEILLRNDQDAIIESTNSNLFIVSNSVLYTVPVTDGCVAGIMRMQIINLAIANNYRVYETSFKPRNLLVADEVFLTNAISGIRWVKSYRQKKYIKELTPTLLKLLNASV